MLRKVLTGLGIASLFFILFAGAPLGPEQRYYPEQKTKVVKNTDWTVGDYIAAAGVGVTTLGVVGGLYLNSRRKKSTTPNPIED